MIASVSRLAPYLCTLPLIFKEYSSFKTGREHPNFTHFYLLCKVAFINSAVYGFQVDIVKYIVVVELLPVAKSSNWYGPYSPPYSLSRPGSLTSSHFSCGKPACIKWQ